MNRKPTLLRKFGSVIEAQLAQSYLEGFGIASFLMTDDAGGMHPHLQGSIGVRLMVAEEDRDSAQRLLDSANQANN